MIVYTDTSVIGGCFDPEFKEHSLALFEELKAGAKRLLLSNLVLLELQMGKAVITKKITEVPKRYKTEVKTTVKAVNLAKTYICEGALSNKSYNDALHIALATLHYADVLASWNFKHIVNVDRIKLYNAINQKMGYRQIEIKTPLEILNHSI